MATRPDLMAKLLELPPEEREDLARALLDSLDQEVDEYELTPEEEAELDEAVAEADRGEGIPAADFLRQLREAR